MISPSRMPYSRTACAIMLAVVVFSATGGFTAFAQPTPPAERSAATGSQQLAAGLVGGAEVELLSESVAIPLDSPYRFTGRISVPEDTDTVIMRVRVYNPSGRLMTQRTQIVNDPEPGTTTATFERETSDLALSPGTYPVEMEVRVGRGGTVESNVLHADLFIFDPAAPRLSTTFAVRITGQPLADPQGCFVADPAQFTRSRDDVGQLARWVVGNPDARVTLAISPLLLEEWRRISQGYDLAGPEGVISVIASDPVPAAYAETLSVLGAALQTGRLELAAMGYSDPNLAELAAHELESDVAPQYAEGTSAVLASIESTPSTGTIPADGFVPASMSAALTEQGLEYAVIDAAHSRSGSTTATTGLYRVKDEQLKVLVSDPQAVDAVLNGDSRTVVTRAFALHSAGAKNPLVIACDVGVDRSSAVSVIASADALADQPWAQPSLAREAAAPSIKRAVALTTKKPTSTAPSGYWDDVAEARGWARALDSALGAPTADASSARKRSLIAQCSAWADPNGGWALADRGRTFATTVTRASQEILDTVDLRVEPVTLAGSQGDVPITITNGSDRVLVVELSGDPDGGVEIQGDTKQRIELPPQDTFVELPVAMPNSLSGQLSVTISAGDMVLETQTVPIRASYLDRLVMIVGVSIVLGVLLFIVVRKARSAPADEQQRTERDTPPSKKEGA